ncbi:MAG: hypothetical protein LBE04_04870 [Prevotellaceae bacterium]|jgi:hypothetical protein|nr:hypothetical protein [Prevotellaceae bacterium]
MKTVKLFPVFILCASLLACTSETQSDSADPLYENVPIIADCTAGALSEAEKGKVLTYINSIRETHGLPGVVCDDKNNILAQKAALIGAANADISSVIMESDFCYSSEAAQECARSNRSLWGSTTANWPVSEIHVNDWMTELNSTNINCRRRLLDPFLKSITFGRIIGSPKKGEYKYVSSAILMTASGNVDLSEYDIQYVAYPQGIYNAKLFDQNSFLSFSILYDKYIKMNNGASIDFSKATIEVSAGSQPLEIVEGSISYDSIHIVNSYNGLPNNLQWKVAGLTKNITYTVKISNVTVAEEPKNYEYTFSFK